MTTSRDEEEEDEDEEESANRSFKQLFAVERFRELIEVAPCVMEELRFSASLASPRRPSWNCSFKC